MKIEKSLFKSFNKTKPTGLLQSETYKRIYDLVDDTVTESHWTAFYGPIGAGKSDTVDDALERIGQQRGVNLRIVNLYWPERTGINISEILNQIIYTLGQEFLGTQSPRRGKEIRMYQVLEILTEAKRRGMHVVLSIDEAHELHHMTLKALKRLWLFRYKGERDLLSIILVGQEGLERIMQSDQEVRIRAKLHELRYSDEELAAIAKYSSADMLTWEEAAEVASRVQGPGEIMYYLRSAMLRARTLSRERVTIDDFELPKPAEEQQNKKRQRGKKMKVDDSKLEELENKFGKGAQKNVKPITAS